MKYNTADVVKRPASHDQWKWKILKILEHSEDNINVK